MEGLFSLSPEPSEHLLTCKFPCLALQTRGTLLFPSRGLTPT